MPSHREAETRQTVRGAPSSPVPAGPMSNKPWEDQRLDTARRMTPHDSWGMQGLQVTLNSRLHLEGLNRCYKLIMTSRVEKCAVHCWHITSSPHQWTKSCSSLIDAIDSMKSQRKIIPVVFTLHSTCAHVDTFFLLRWNLLILVLDPQRWRMFLLI